MKRYSIVDKDDFRGRPETREDPHGEWLRWEEVAPLLCAARCLWHAYKTDSRFHDAWGETIRNACKGITEP